MSENELNTLIAFYGKLSNFQKRAFWQVQGGKAEKMAYLLRWGSFELPRRSVA